MSDETLEAVVNMTKESSELNEDALDALWKMLLDWPPEFSFPVLDVARLAVLHPEINHHLCSDRLLTIIRRNTTADAIAANQMLTFRLLANMFVQECGQNFGLNCSEEFINTLLTLPAFGSKNNQV